MRITIEMQRPRKPRSAVVVVTALAIALGGAGVATASHLFGDVPTSSQFHQPIAAIARAGITSGCGSGDFCPKAAITREQEAAFLHRGLPRVAVFEEPGPLIHPNDFAVTYIAGEVEILVPGSSALGIGANQFVEVDARMSVGSDCPPFSIELDADTDASAAVASVSGYAAARSEPLQLTTSYVFPASPGPHTYYLRVRTDACPSGAQSQDIMMIATTHTFGDTGTDVLHCQNELGCPSLAGRPEQVR